MKSGELVTQNVISEVTSDMFSDVGPSPVGDMAATLDFPVPAIEDNSKQSTPAMLYNTVDGKAPNGSNGLGLRSDCFAAGNCQAGNSTTAYNTTQFIAAEDFIVASGTQITGSCIQGVFWNFVNPASDPMNQCSDDGTEDWTIVYYDDAGGFPGVPIGTFTACTGTGCGAPGATTITKVLQGGNFAGIPIDRFTASHAAVSVTPGNCYYVEWAVALSASPCGFFWQAGAAGNLRAMQDGAFDGYECCELLTEDLSICVDLPLDNASIINCAQGCTLFPPLNDDCINATALVNGVPVMDTTEAGLAGDADIPDPPQCLGQDFSSQEAVWFTFTGTGNQVQLDAASNNMDTVLGVFCGGCTKLYGVACNDDDPNSLNGTDSQIVMDTILGETYHVVLTSQIRCGDYTMTMTDLGANVGTPADCVTCTKSVAFGTVTVDETVGEPCDDTGNGRTNDGCNLNGLPTEFVAVVDGDVINGNSWALAGTRDQDRFWVNNPGPDPALIIWQAEAQFPNNLLALNIGGDINNADCANLTLDGVNQAARCTLNTLVVPNVAVGDYVLGIAHTEFDFNSCNGVDALAASGDEDTCYTATVAVIQPCTLTDPGGAQTEDACGAADTNSGCNGASDADFQAIALGTPLLGECNTAAGSRDTDWYTFSAPSAGDYDLTIEAEFPVVTFVQDHGVGGIFGACATATTLLAGAVLPCTQATFTFTVPTAGNDIVVFVAPGNLDGTGIFAGYPCPPPFPPGQDGNNEYLLQIDQASSGDCLGGFGGCYDSCISTDQNNCESNCGVFQGTGVSCPATPCIADQTTAGAGAGDPLFGIPDASCTAADINFYVNLFIIQDCRADLTTAGAGVGSSGYGVQDASVTAADIGFYINAFQDCVNSAGASCSPGGPCTP